MTRNQIWDFLSERVDFRALTRDQCTFFSVRVISCDKIDGEEAALSCLLQTVATFAPQVRLVLTFTIILTVASHAFQSSVFPLSKSFPVRLHSLCRFRSGTTHWGFKSCQHRPVIWPRFSNPKWPSPPVSCPPPVCKICFVCVWGVPTVSG